MIYVKVAFLFVGVMFTIANVIRASLRNDIPAANVVYQAAGITGFIVLQWLI